MLTSHLYLPMLEVTFGKLFNFETVCMTHGISVTALNSNPVVIVTAARRGLRIAVYGFTLSCTVS